MFKQWGNWAVIDQVDESLRTRKHAELIDEHGVIVTMVNVGKKNSGRMLNGKEFDEFPIAG